MINHDDKMNLHESGRSPNALGNATMFCERDIESIIGNERYSLKIYRSLDGLYFIEFASETVNEIEIKNLKDPDIGFVQLLRKIKEMYAK